MFLKLREIFLCEFYIHLWFTAALAHFNIQGTLTRSNRQGHGYKMRSKHNFSRVKIFIKYMNFIISCTLEVAKKMLTERGKDWKIVV